MSECWPNLSGEMEIGKKLRRKAIVESSEQVAARLKELAKGLELDELVVVAWTYDPAPRHRSYELLAQAFGMEKTEAHSA
jgi:alkanesulfonate monooxygenase SsuD/methylene tetrahydromethanopterin reductase-like flavin-dependent oxidoreductase (luciferase family)